VSRIVVTGMGIISAIGNTVAENRIALLEGRCGIVYQSQIPSKYADSLPFGEIKLSDEALKTKLDVTEPGTTRTSLLALHAFNEAVQNSGLSDHTLWQSDTALIGASTVGGMCRTDELFADANSPEAATEYLGSYDYASPILYLQKRYDMQGIINTINTACSSSANAIMMGARLIKSGLAKRAIVGGADSLAKFTINGFNALHILSPEICTPFDAGRRGLNLGEGAAFLVLEREEDALHKKIYASIAGYGNSSDSYHASSLSDNGEGPFLAMQSALETASLLPAAIDFINAHGTGTENNDLVESIAMQRLFQQPPPFASTKGNTGHTLGAAGAIEAVFSILNLHGQELFPALQFKNTIPETGLQPQNSYQQTAIEHVMSNSFGFGGNCTSLIFSKA